MSDREDWNGQIIKEFRENAGKVGGRFEGFPLLLLHSKGAKTGRERVNPLAYQADGERYMIFASKGGAPTNPDWYHNLIANPDASIEVGTDTIAVRATVLTGQERDRVWTRQIERAPAFGEYEARSGRTIPVVALDPVG